MTIWASVQVIRPNRHTVGWWHSEKHQNLVREKESEMVMEMLMIENGEWKVKSGLF